MAKINLSKINCKNSSLELGHSVEGGCPGGLPRVGVDAVEGEQRRRAAVQRLKRRRHLVHVTDLVHAVPVAVGDALYVMRKSNSIPIKELSKQQ